MSKEKDIEIFEKIEKLCQRIEGYTTKVTSVKNEVKTTIYIKKIQKLQEMISTKVDNYASSKKTIKQKEQNPKIMEQEDFEQELEENKYNPYSEDFLYKNRLDRVNGNVESLLEELKNEDKLGYRNAYVINEIKKHIEQREAEELRKQMLALSKNKTNSLRILNTIKNIIQKIKEAFKGNNNKRYKKEEI